MTILQKISHYIKIGVQKIKNELGSPLIEEAMLIGLSVLMITIIAALTLDIVDWAQGAIKDIFNQLDYIRTNFLGFLQGSQW